MTSVDSEISSDLPKSLKNSVPFLSNLKLSLKKYLEESQKQDSLSGILEATNRVEQKIEALCKTLK